MLGSMSDGTIAALVTFFIAFPEAFGKHVAKIISAYDKARVRTTKEPT